jgi:hypothetical protein
VAKGNQILSNIKGTALFVLFIAFLHCSICYGTQCTLNSNQDTSLTIFLKSQLGSFVEKLPTDEEITRTYGKTICDETSITKRRFYKVAGMSLYLTFIIDKEAPMGPYAHEVILSDFLPLKSEKISRVKICQKAKMRALFTISESGLDAGLGEKGSEEIQVLYGLPMVISDYILPSDPNDAANVVRIARYKNRIRGISFSFQE